jgi:hypothetical protein
MEMTLLQCSIGPRILRHVAEKSQNYQRWIAAAKGALTMGSSMRWAEVYPFIAMFSVEKHALSAKVPC